MAKSFYVGFDLGTTNSTSAIFDGERVHAVQSALGGALTPSVVRLNAKDTPIVGARARRFLERDPENTQSEFKRLMGTGKTIHFPAADVSKQPQELAALVLASLRADVEQQLGFAVDQAVITVPALFEVPQSAATAEAARLAGLQRVELLQEPVASALAAGWEAESAQGSWMVFDLGGGTFDVSLLESREGLLRVVGHDGDNFLGGRDFDRRIVDWCLTRLAAEEGAQLRRDEPSHQQALRQIALAAEEAKIELTRVEQTSVGGAMPLEVGDDLFDLDIALDRATLESLCEPVVERTIEVCLRLLREHGQGPDDLETVVLVGGPSVMPLVRRRVAEALARPAEEGLDPMALVAQGAAIYAATSGLEAQASASRKVPGTSKNEVPGTHENEVPGTHENEVPGTAREVPGTAREGHGTHEVPGTSAGHTSAGHTSAGHTSVGRTSAKPHQLWLQYPAVTAVTTPHIVGRLAEPGTGPPPARLEIADISDPSASTNVELDADGAFVAQVVLKAKKLSTFVVKAWDAAGEPVTVTPSELRIMHGVTLSDPPLSRALGVALANNSVRTYFERGVPLPARRTFGHRTIESLVPGTGGQLDIPIVQGEFEQAHLCRLVGSLRISADDLTETLPIGTDIEVTLELDRGGRLSARAHIPRIDRVFEEVARLLVPDADPETLTRESEALQSRLIGLQTSLSGEDQRKRLTTLDRRLIEAQLATEAAKGGDADSGQRARRILLDLEAEVGELEDLGKWPELEAKSMRQIATATHFVAQFGNEMEKRLLDTAISGAEQALKSRSHDLLRQHMKVVRDVGNAAFYRHPEAWSWELDYYASHVEEATDPKAAKQIIGRAREAREQADSERLKSLVTELWRLFPAEARQRRLSHRSGIH